MLIVSGLPQVSVEVWVVLLLLVVGSDMLTSLAARTLEGIVICCLTGLPADGCMV